MSCHFESVPYTQHAFSWRSKTTDLKQYLTSNTLDLHHHTSPMRIDNANSEYTKMLFVSFLYVPVNNFSVISGQVFPGFNYSTKQQIKCSAQ